MLAVEVLCPPCEVRRHFVAMTLVHALRDIVQEGLFVGLQWHVFIGLDNLSGGLAFLNAEVVVAGHRTPGHSANWLIHNRFVIDGQELLADSLGHRVKTCARAAGEDEAYHCIVSLFLL